MKIDINRHILKEAMKAMNNLNMMDWPEVTDGNKQSDIYGITGALNDFYDEVIEDLDIDDWEDIDA